MIEQRTEEWHALRRGRVTASKFKAVMTEPRAAKDKLAGKLSGTAETYLYELIAELATGESKQFSSAPTDHGTEYEPDAAELYQQVQKIEAVEAGFMISPTNPLIGCSPDLLIGERGGAEIKCPYNQANHMRHWHLGLQKDHVDQIKGTLCALDKDYWDFISYSPFVDPRFALYVERITRDEEYDDKFWTSINKFMARYGEALAELDMPLPHDCALPCDVDISEVA